LTNNHGLIAPHRRGLVWLFGRFAVPVATHWAALFHWDYHD